MLLGLDLPSVGRGTTAGVDPTSGQLSESEEKHLRLTVKWKENQIVLVAAIHTLNGDAGPLEGKVAGNQSLGMGGD